MITGCTAIDFNQNYDGMKAISTFLLNLQYLNRIHDKLIKVIIELQRVLLISLKFLTEQSPRSGYVVVNNDKRILPSKSKTVF